MSKSDRRFRRWLHCQEAHRLNGFLVTHPPNLYYLFNFTGSTGLALCIEGETQLLVDSRYLEQAKAQCVNCQVVLADRSLEESLKELLPDTSSVKGHRRRIGVEAGHISYEFVLRLQSWKTPAEWIPTHNLIEELRMIKDKAELQSLQEVFQMAHRALDRTIPLIHPGMREVEVAGLLELELRRTGSLAPPFETIVASGPRSSQPHGTASSKRIASDEFVLIDFGAKHKGYCSDLTRIHAFSDNLMPDIFHIVLEAQDAALGAIRVGGLSSEIDQAARRVIEKRGHGPHFGHSCGHGLGLEIHELPLISTRRARQILPGMVFTIEPGIYLPGQFGIRLEDAVVVTETGYRLLSQKTF